MPFADAWGGGAYPAASSIPDLVRGLEAVAVAVVGSDGALKDANRGFLVLMTRLGNVPESADVTRLFAAPTFRELVDRPADPFESTIHRGVISFGGDGGRATSLRGTIYRLEGDLVVVAEHDVVGLTTLRSTLLELQDDLSEKLRQIVHLEHRVARLQDLADAALRDRDILLDALDQQALRDSAGRRG